MKTLSKLLSLLLFISIFSSCKSDDNDDSNNSDSETKTHTLSRSTNYGEDWIYFSFSTGEEVTNIDDSNYQTNLDWDIAFNRYNVRTNGGTSGAGEGAAYDVGFVDFNSITEAQEFGYTKDSTIQIIQQLNIPNPPTYIDSNGSTAFVGNNGLSNVMDFSGPPPIYTPTNHIYILKTADNKSVKLQITSFYNDQGNYGYINLKYFYQADSSLDLDTNQ